MLRKLLAILLVIAAASLAFYSLRPDPSASGKSLTVYCAAGLKKPVEAIAAQYEKETGTSISLQFGGTGTLLTQLRLANRGDLFLAADDGSLADARKLGVTREVLPLVIQHPAIAVAKGNPKNIRTLADLEKPEIRLALPNPEAASIGKVVKKLLGARWEVLAAKAAVMKPTVTEVAADTRLGAVDAAIVWDSVIPQFEGLEAVQIPELSFHKENASAAVLDSAVSPVSALAFAHYLAAPEKGGALFKEQGFQPVGDAPWVAGPAPVLHNGDDNDGPAIEPPAVLLPADVQELTPADASTWMSQNPGALILDVRMAEEVAREGKLSGSRHHDYLKPATQEYLATLDRQQPCLIYCAIGGRSRRMAVQMHDLGFTHLVILKGGLNAWQTEGRSVQK
jgi:molybdate transport system substrate-binding protein